MRLALTVAAMALAACLSGALVGCDTEAHDADRKVQADVERGRELTAQATPEADAQARKLLESAA
ncbi:MAG: hypothetical protein ACREJC_21815, partial [Tepidisphaeraceae bacterium]